LRAVQRLRARAGGLHRVAGLSARELEVLQMLAEGIRSREIAEQLVLSVRTVERHLASAYRKLGVHSRIDAVNEYRAIQGSLT
jgi:DNA-binding CsgD family transcriptional regulator